MKSDFELMALAIDMNGKIQHIKDFYPDLQKFNAIQRLIAISDRWSKMFSDQYSSKEGGI